MMAEHDPTGLGCEANRSRWRPLAGGVAVRLGANHDPRAARILAAAADATGCRCIVSDANHESDDTFIARLATLGVDRLRLVGTVSEVVRTAAHRAGIAVDDAPAVGHPDIELPRWLREQSVTVTLHRHGHRRLPR
jgi:RHH-type transcriptional regulator, proline utilization regulon repressor / proline dehydrogenase / delta 1-pyrroline-5-carboxylate dehydrogenase